MTFAGEIYTKMKDVKKVCTFVKQTFQAEILKKDAITGYASSALATNMKRRKSQK